MISDTKNITRTYYQEEIQQILQIAIARQAYQGEFTHEQLLEIATELEISPECLQAAEKEWLLQQSDNQKRQDFHQFRRGKLQKRLGKYAISNSFLLLLDLVSGSGISWSLYILLFWGLFLGLDVWNNFSSQGEDYEKAFQKWQRDRQIKQSINTFLDKLLKA
ncbi:MAG TPA: hypothetical protein DEV81_00650 [Cyanobacteria bacterium UBA11049]|nr:hypothetical protein [Cyanobacteria bacterium UBA11049]